MRKFAYFLLPRDKLHIAVFQVI